MKSVVEAANLAQQRAPLGIPESHTAEWGDVLQPMLTLIIEKPAAVSPPRLSACAEVWRDNDGTVCAYGQVLGEEYWMHLPRLASFRFSLAALEVTGFAP